MEKYEIISEFICAGRYMLVIKFENATLIMTEEDWKWTYGQLHPNKREKNKNVA